ncbi:MAG: Dabb family protein [Lachnospiraceae bacterium]|nr:Dabb family protein [Lachnospiraceae bacterium]
MVKHIILWDMADGLSNDEKAQRASDIKSQLEALYGVVPGLLEIKVYDSFLPNSNAELVLYSVFESQEALNGYQVHPAHVKVATETVRPFTKNRRCVDFEA